MLADRGLTQKELAERIFINPSTVTRWITGGSTPQPRTVEAIANAIGVRKEWLLTGEGEIDGPASSDARHQAMVKEKEPPYEALQHVIFIEKSGTPDQIALMRSFLKMVHEQIGDTSARSGDK